MTCHDARERFSALLDEMLTREERADVYGHLATCADCRRELAAVERTVALVRGATPVRAPAGFVDRVVAAARPAPWYRRAARAAFLPWPVKVPLGAAAVLLVGGLAVLLFRGLAEQQRAARYEPAPPALGDRAAPAAPAPALREDRTSDDRARAERPSDLAARSDPAPPAVQSSEREAPPERQVGEARGPAAAPPAPAAEARREALAKLEAPRAQPMPAPPDVVARLGTPERDTAARALAALAARLGGAETGRRTAGDTLTVDLAIPRERYADFTREVARLGDYRLDTAPASLPETVRIAVHLRP